MAEAQRLDRPARFDLRTFSSVDFSTHGWYEAESHRVVVKIDRDNVPEYLVVFNQLHHLAYAKAVAARVNFVHRQRSL